jgi:hypothetical protein
MARRSSEVNSREVDYADLIYRSNIFILENDSLGNYTGTYRIIDYIDRLLNPFKDTQYKRDIEKIIDEEPVKGINPNTTKRNNEEWYHKMMMAKHTALIDLAFRNGYLGNKKRISLDNIEEEHE